MQEVVFSPEIFDYGSASSFVTYVLKTKVCYHVIQHAA